MFWEVQYICICYEFLYMLYMLWVFCCFCSFSQSYQHVSATCCAKGNWCSIWARFCGDIYNSIIDQVLLWHCQKKYSRWGAESHHALSGNFRMIFLNLKHILWNNMVWWTVSLCRSITQNVNFTMYLSGSYTGPSLLFVMNICLGMIVDIEGILSIHPRVVKSGIWNSLWKICFWQREPLWRDAAREGGCSSEKETM